jgi:hypothetical protein
MKQLWINDQEEFINRKKQDGPSIKRSLTTISVQLGRVSYLLLLTQR